MPSLHGIWALLVWFNANRLPTQWRRAMKAFVVLTIWAAMGLDDTHWITDLIVAAPLTLAVQAACVTRRFDLSRARLDIACGAALTAAWLFGLRSGQFDNTPLPLAWAAVALTLWWSFVRLNLRETPGSEDRTASASSPDSYLLRERCRPEAVA
jgi:hypothetical protein